MKMVKMLCGTMSFWTLGTVNSVIMAILAVLASLVDRSGNTSHRVFARLWGRLMVYSALSGVKLINPERLRGLSGPVIYMCNHSSYFDIFSFLAGIGGLYSIISKEYIFRIPFIGLAMKRSGYIPINQEKPKKIIQSLRLSALAIKKGRSILIFPEGRRSPDGNILPFMRGAFRLAKEARVPVVVIRIQGAFEIMPPFQKVISRLFPGRVTLKIAEVIPAVKVAEMAEKELNEYTRQVMVRPV